MFSPIGIPSSDIPTNTGSIHAALSWSPDPLEPKTESKLNISFYDPTGTAPLTNTDVKYNLIIYDKNNHPVITKQNLLAKNADGTETIVFPTAQIYHMQVQITGLLKPGQTPDFTRNGVATGYVLVPEFPSPIIAILIGSVLGILIVIERSMLLIVQKLPGCSHQHPFSRPGCISRRKNPMASYEIVK